MLVLLLGLMPFIHGHLGQPVQSGWHIHALSAAADVQTGPQFDGLAGLASHHQHATQQGRFALQAHEPSDVELVLGMQSRLSQIRLASLFNEVAAVETALVFAQRLVPAEPTVIHSTPDSALPRVHHSLPPPSQAPPALLA